MTVTTLPPLEALQSYILSTLAASSSGTVPDSRQLEWNGVHLTTTEQQNAVRGALDSLGSKEVSS